MNELEKRRDGLESEPLLGGRDNEEQEWDKDKKLRIQPKRTIIVEPLLMLYAIAGLPVMTLRSQYMYQRIASDMGINLNNLSSKFHVHV